MDWRVTADENSATFTAAQVRHDRAEDSWFADLVKTLWPVKGSAALEQYTRCPDRTARAYSSGDRLPSASVLRDLIRGDEGYRVLTWIMAVTPPAWWLNVQSELRVAKAYRDVKPKLREIFDGIDR